MTEAPALNHSRTHKRQAGFTLFELLIVMAIAAVSVGAVAVLFRPGSGTVEIKSIAPTLASRTKTVRSIAIQKQSERVVLFDTAQKTIDFKDGKAPLRLKDNIQLSIVAAEGERRSENLVGIRFFPNGSSSGGSVTLKQETLAYEIRVNWLTGRVSTNNVMVR